MVPYVEWVKDPAKGFVLKDNYDPITNKWEFGGKLRLLGIQEQVLGHCLTPREDGTFPYTTIVYSCPKKSGKTTVAASVGAYFMDEGPQGSEILCVANDKEQVQFRVFADLSFHAREYWKVMPTQSLIVHPKTRSSALALAQEYKSAAGSRHALTIWDELWGFQSERSQLMWAELTPVPTVPISLRFIVTYAGITGESDLLQGIYEQVVKKDGRWGEAVPELESIRDRAGNPVCFHKGRIFVYWDTMPRMPWQTDEYYAEQWVSLRPTDFMRLHENAWVTSSEAFIPVEMWDEAAKKRSKSLLYDMENPLAQLPIVVAVDVGTKHDASAVVGVYYDRKRGMFGVAFHRIWEPTEGEILDLEETVEQYVLDVSQRFRIQKVVYDPHNFIRSMVTLRKKGLRMEEFPQTVELMTSASQLLYELMRSGGLEAYPAEDLRRHIELARAEQKGRGFRLVKEKNSRAKIDAAVALAMACYGAKDFIGSVDDKPIRIESPFSDRSQWRSRRKSMEPPWLPEPLRSK